VADATGQQESSRGTPRLPRRQTFQISGREGFSCPQVRMMVLGREDSVVRTGGMLVSGRERIRSPAGEDDAEVEPLLSLKATNIKA
jgi:hypothetical protein